ncbi:MAG TPA: ATP-binding protein [Usitatibacter sp.]|nr:ATP-binding protein [Usitatibacter sp.]
MNFLDRLRFPGYGYAAALFFTVLMVSLRWAVDPWLGARQPLATLYGAVALAAWVGGWRPALLTVVLGYLACNYLFIEPRGRLDLRGTADLLGSALFLLSCFFIILFGEGLRRADRRARRAEGALRGKALAQRLLVEIHDATRGLRDPNQVIGEIVDRVGRDFHASRCLYVEVDSEGTHASVARDYIDGVDSVAGRHKLGSFSAALTMDYQAGRTVAIADVRADERTRAPESLARLDRAGIASFIGVPVVKDGRLVGIFGVQDRAPRTWSADDVALVEQLAERTWLAVESARAESAVRESEERYRTIAETLSEADRRKDEFLATLAHELRNPLAPIRTALEIFRLKEPANSTLHGPRDIIDRQVGQLTRLVDDLLEASRISQGKVQLRRERIDVAAALESAVEGARPLIDRGRHQLKVEAPADALVVDADPTRLTQIVLNLLNNAAKYTPPGGHITLAAARDGNDVVIRVRDTGIGITREQIPLLFRMFSQAGAGMDRAQGGLGIGLALVRGFVEMHGGRVSVESEGLGRGSEFTVRLPLAEAPDARLSA